MIRRGMQGHLWTPELKTVSTLVLPAGTIERRRAKVGRPAGGHGSYRHIMVAGEIVGAIYAARSGSVRCRGWDVYSYTSRKDGRMESGEHLVKLYHELTLRRAIDVALAWKNWPVQCWVYMSGDHGYLPDNSGCATSRYSAVEGLIELFELGDGRRARELRKTGLTSLGRNYGAEYCEVSPCKCPECRSGCTVETADSWECGLCQ